MAGSTTFSQYAQELFTDIRPDVVVEIGPDTSLRFIPRLSPYCGRYIGVTLPEYYDLSQPSFNMHKDMGVDNFELIAGNAVDLSELVPKADVIIVHNVLLDLTGNDTALMWEYRRGERDPNPEEEQKLAQRFGLAGGKSYQEFLKVANPGQILTFHRAQQTVDFIRNITKVVGVDDARVSTTPMELDGLDYSGDYWNLVTIDNR